MTETATPPLVPLRRPRLVWVIFLSYAIIGGFGLVEWLAMLLGLAKFGTMSTSEQLFHFGVGALAIGAATSLWLLRRVAFPLFSLTFLLSFGSAAWRWLPGGMYSNMVAKGGITAVCAVLGTPMGVLLAIGMWWYVFRLWRRGVLR